VPPSRRAVSHGGADNVRKKPRHPSRPRHSEAGRGALVSRAAFNAIGGCHEEFGKAVEDWEFFAKATLKGLKLDVLPKPNFWYRVRADGTVGFVVAGVAPIFSKIIATCTGFLGNFLLRRFLVFPQRGVVRI
jgi:GT2 family glycosyltransferase